MRFNRSRIPASAVRMVLLVCCAAVAVNSLTPRSSCAQASAPKAKSPSGAPKAPAGTKAPAGGSKTGPSGGKAPAAAAKPPAKERSAAEEAARNDILQSRSWQDLMRQFNDWLSIQMLYGDEQVRHIRSRLETGINRMSAEQLQRFEGDLREKLEVLTSDLAVEAQNYLAAKFAVASDAYARRIRQQLPDVLSMTPAQIEQRLSIYTAKRESRAQVQQSFEQSRERKLASNAAQLQARQQQQRDRAATRGAGAVQTAAQNNNFTPARDYFPDSGGGPNWTIGIGIW